MTSDEPLDVVVRFSRLLDAQVIGRDAVPALGARRVTLALGDSLVEVLSPDGTGPVAEHLESRRGGPFAAGIATVDLAALRHRLDAGGVGYTDLGGQLFLDAAALGVPGLSLVISEERQRRRTGLVDGLYEVTHLTGDPSRCCAALEGVFGVAADEFVPIESGNMCYAETEDVTRIRERAREFAPRDWTGDNGPAPDGMFLHPKALGGVMMGISRTSHAWSWSGHPDWVVPPA